MTVVARGKLFNRHVVLGDLVVSGDEDSCFIVPTVGSVTNVFPVGSGYTPTRLKQKVSIVADNLAIGWSGNYIAAKTVITELYEESQKKRFNSRSLHHYFRQLGNDVWGLDVQFTGYIVDSGGIVPFTYGKDGRIEDFTSEAYGKVGIIGSGSEDIRIWIDSDKTYFNDTPTDNIGHSIGSCILLAGTLIQDEVITSASLRTYYGGGYEIAMCYNHRFFKIGSVVFFTWRTRKVNNTVGILLHQACKYFYVDDVLVINALTFRYPTLPATGIRTERTAFGVPPIYRKTSPEYIDMITPRLNNFSSDWQCHSFEVPGPNDTIQVLGHVEHQPNFSVSISINNHQISVTGLQNILNVIGPYLEHSTIDIEDFNAGAHLDQDTWIQL